MRNLLARTAAIAVIAAGMVGVNASSANAWSMWANPSWGGKVWGYQVPCGFDGFPSSVWDIASSWQNGGSGADASDYTGSGGVYVTLWYMPPFGSSSYVGSSRDNRADSAFNYC
jgi:hypothetical protein